jgi:hypothetical protein
MNLPRPLVYVFLSIPWVLAGLGLLYLCSLRYPLSGTFVVQSAFDGGSAWVNPWLPGERVMRAEDTGENWSGQRVLDDPVYFTARTPGPYESVEIALEYRSIHQPLLEFGLVRDAAGKELDLVPLYSSELEKPEWRRVMHADAKGYVRQGVSDTRLMDPRPEGLAIWDATATMPLMTDPVSAEQATTVSLRGSHDFYVVPAGGRVDMTFVLQGVNRSVGSDLATFRLFRGDEEIGYEVLPASGSREQGLTKIMEQAIKIPNASPGVYRIAFHADDDVVIREIRTTSRRWVVGPRVYFADSVGFATSTLPGIARTSSRHLVAETFHVEGKQDIQFGSAVIRVRDVHTAFRGNRNDTERWVRLEAPRGDVRLVGDGFFALRDDAWFDPRPTRLTDATELGVERIEAVMTPYVRPQDLGDGWYRSTFIFSLDPRQDGLRFVLSAPGIASRAGAVDLRNVTLTYKRPAVGFEVWFKTLRQELANAWHRL